MHKGDCIFCKIINKEIPAKIRYEDEDYIAFDDINPVAPIHVLIVPKRAVESLESYDINSLEEHANLLRVARKIAKRLNTQDNYKLFMNVGEKVQQVHHLHLHLYGGWDENVSGEELEKI